MKTRLSQNALFAAAVILLLGLIARLAMFGHETQDINGFLRPWINSFREGGLDAFRNPISDYNAPYLYILMLIAKLPPGFDVLAIKLVSVIFDFVIAVTAARIALDRDLGEKTALAGMAAALFFPTILLNSAYWGQCDSIYAAFCLLSLRAALNSKGYAASVWAGLAFAFKLQAIFFLPVAAVFIAARKIKPRHIWLAPAAYLVSAIPALVMGWSIFRVIGVYVDQTGSYSAWLYLNAPSVYAFGKIENPGGIIPKLGILAAGALVIAVWVFAYVRRRRFDDARIVSAALLLCLGIAWLLPNMHDRYFYTAEMLSVVYAMFFPRRWIVPLLTLGGSAGGYIAYLAQGRLSDNLAIHAASFLIALILIVYFLIKDTEGVVNIQIFGRAKCFDTKKAERWFKERRIKFQFVDLARYGMSDGEYDGVKKIVGEENILDGDGYIVTPVVRDGKKRATVGYRPEIWESWRSTD